MSINAKSKAKLIAKLALDKKAEDLVVLDMTKTGNFCDYFVISSASSHRQVKAIADNIKDGFEKESIYLRSVEGQAESGWTLVDCADVVAHIFYSPTREFYNLERLWQDAPRVKLLAEKRKNVRKAGRRKSK